VTIGAGRKMKEQLIALCGMNCGVCVSYLAMKNELSETAAAHPRRKRRGIRGAAA